MNFFLDRIASLEAPIWRIYAGSIGKVIQILLDVDCQASKDSLAAFGPNHAQSRQIVPCSFHGAIENMNYRDTKVADKEGVTHRPEIVAKSHCCYVRILPTCSCLKRVSQADKQVRYDLTLGQYSYVCWTNWQLADCV